MWRLVFVCMISWAGGQSGRAPRQDHNGRGWDIRLAVPGQPGNDYPTLGNIPRTSFSCAGREPGYYADLETNCQAFRVCTAGSTYGFQSFLCPNGTLFNQAVFVCDWWMNVNCGTSQQFFNNNSDKFGNLKLGPQLMKDIKKMLTHPMRNPYDKSTMKSNLVVMQDYKPPSGQLFPNSALMVNVDRTPNNVFIPPKVIQQNYGQNNFIPRDTSFAASTPSPSYVPASINTQSTQSDAEVFQRQRQNGQYSQVNRQNSQSGNQFGRLVQPTISTNTLRQTQLNTAPTTYNPQNFNNQRTQTNGQLTQNTENKSPVRWNSGKQTEFGISLSRQQYNYNSNQEKQPYTAATLPQFSSDITGQIGNEAKENLVRSTNVPSTVITKTLTFNRIVQEPKTGNPKSRIVFKTWIVKPSKSAKLIVEPTPYTYNRPTENTNEKQVDDSTPYIYNRPTTPSPTERLETEETPYVYNRPTVEQISTVRELPRVYISPTTPAPTVARLYQTPSTVEPTKATRIYLPPTTLNPLAKLYLPPSQPSPIVISRQYLSPNAKLQAPFSQSAQLQASPTSPSPVYVAPTKENSNKPTFTLTKHSRINANHNNLTFADILTKEKLDITVNDIVKDTSKVLKSTSNEQFGRLQQDINSVDYPDDTYLPADTGSRESLTPSSLPDISQSSRLTQSPSINLEPPLESFKDSQITNQISNLPFFKEPTLPSTIERTVSLKISIPEKVASYLFKSRNDSNFDRLEILNTGSSNYLVLTNQLATSTTPTFIPIGKLIADKNTSLSDSQALVFSLLANSINVAKEYNNIAQQNVQSNTATQSQFQNVNNDELSRITNQISQLTSSQYSGNNQNGNIQTVNNQNGNNFASGKIVTTSQTTTTNGATQFQNSQYTNNVIPSTEQNAQYNSPPQQSGSFYSSQFQFGNGYRPLIANQNQIYSGQFYQLPVPEVTSQIYNQQSPAKLIQPTNVGNKYSEADHLRGSTQNSNSNNNEAKQSSAEVEIVKSHSLPLPSPAKLQFAPGENNYNSQESSQAFENNFLNNEGISAQLQDNIIGTIPHPLEKNKVLTYKKDQSYYVYTKLDNNNVVTKNDQTNGKLQSNNGNNQNAKLVQSNNNFVSSFQFIPSVSYQLDDDKEQEKILNAFKLNEFGSPKTDNDNTNNNAGYQIQNPNRRNDVLTTNVEFSVDHPSSTQLVSQRKLNAIYDGPSSYSAPQGSIGFLDMRQRLIQNHNFNSRLEKFDDSNNGNGYPKRQYGY
ncbi:hypothetical protein MSG28_008805 [Choristoneura fumiferana]|uniref:Uncharacterized protein n=1 Tax=Choristoneura fumiferana TaxID=7141 RepID=A0ACC0J835_CHOFU|nr:hypothetical protein MSG28_008805 [Choristoneura fumiferana]